MRAGRYTETRGLVGNRLRRQQATARAAGGATGAVCFMSRRDTNKCTHMVRDVKKLAGGADGKVMVYTVPLAPVRGAPF